MIDLLLFQVLEELGGFSFWSVCSDVISGFVFRRLNSKKEKCFSVDHNIFRENFSSKYWYIEKQ